jgi:pyrimidine operon attenuation protein/uracil phosphoribosyltransferase
MSALLLDSTTLHRAIARMAHEIAERNPAGTQLAIVGIQTGGVFLARRLATQLQAILGEPVPTGVLDAALHRDDLDQRSAPLLRATEIPFDVTGRTIVLVDDVLYSGRTTRAALDALHDFGRPSRVQLAVLIDRGHRELPIRADFVGKNVPTSRSEHVDVSLTEDGGNDTVTLQDRKQ